MPDEVRMLDNQYALLFVRGERPVRDLSMTSLNIPISNSPQTAGRNHTGMVRIPTASCLSALTRSCWKQAAEKDGQDAPKHRFILLTEEELEQKFIELEEQENAEQQKGKEAAPPCPVR